MQRYALKTMYSCTNDSRHGSHEFELQKKFSDHDNIVQIIGDFFKIDESHNGFMMELCEV